MFVGIVLLTGLIFFWLLCMPNWWGDEEVQDDGIRTIIYENGMVYTGTLHNAVPDGKGTAN